MARGGLGPASQHRQAQNPEPRVHCQGTVSAISPGLASAHKQEEIIILTRDVNLELATLAEGAVNDPQLPSGQVHLEPHEELDVGLLFEQGAADHVVVVYHLFPHTQPHRKKASVCARKGQGHTSVMEGTEATMMTGPPSPSAPATTNTY